MSFGVMRFQKYGRSSIYGICLERNRDPNHEFGRSDIDRDQTKYNVILQDPDGNKLCCSNWNKKITNKIKEHGCKERKDSVVMIGVVFTATADYFTPNPEYVPLAKGEEDTREPHQKQKWIQDEKAMEYFQDCLEYYVEVMCNKDWSKILDARIDFDETTPHLQIYSIPIVDIESEKETTYKLSAKELIGGRGDLRRKQDLFHELIGEPRGLKRGDKTYIPELDGKDPEREKQPKRSHKETYEWKREQINQADQEISSKEKAIKIADAKIQQKKDEIASLDSQAESSTERRNRALQEEVQVNDRIRAATNQLAAKEAELGVMMAATMNEEIKQEKIYKQSLNALPGRNALGMIKVDKDNFGQESLSVNKGVYNSLKNYRDTMNSGFEEMRKADAVGKEVVKHLEDLVSNQEQHITREAQRIAAVSLQEDKNRFLKNRDKEKQLNNREAELQDKEAELLQREAELADAIKQGIAEALRSVDISDLTKADRFMEYLNQNYESTITRALADFNAIEEIRSKKAQEQVKKQTQGDSTDDHEWD